MREIDGYIHTWWDKKEVDKPNFDDIRHLCQHEPIVLACTRMYQGGDLTREQALIGMVKALVQVKNDQHEQIKRIVEKSSIPSHILLGGD